MTKVQAAMDGVIEQLPPMLDLGELPLQVVNEKERYTFPYHAPSLMSLLSVTSAEMPQSIGYVLLQVKKKYCTNVSFLSVLQENWRYVFITITS